MFVAHEGGEEARWFAFQRRRSRTEDGLFRNFELSGASCNVLSQLPSVHRLGVLTVPRDARHS